MKELQIFCTKMKELTDCVMRNVTIHNKKGIGLYTNQNADVGSDIEVLLDGYIIKGQVKWKASVEDGELKIDAHESQIKARSRQKVESLAHWLRDEKAEGFKYIIGLKLYDPLPDDIIRKAESYKY